MTTPHTMMTAALVTRYGPPEVVRLAEVPRPVPRAGELLIRVRATTVSSGDARVRAARVPRGMRYLMRLAMGWAGPRQAVLGTELAGVVVAVGAGVTGFGEGDAVIAYPGAAMRAHAEYAVVRAEGNVVPKPEGMPFDEAAALCFGGLTALYNLRAGNLKAAERVLILGASGTVGLAAVQLARHLGATVTAVCSGGNEALVRELGASDVIDYRAADFTRTGRTWDVVLDCVGATSYAHCRTVLAPGGRLLRVVASLPGLLAAPFQGRLSGHRVLAGVSPGSAADMRILCDLAQSGAYRSVIDRTCTFGQIAEAHARVDTERKRGSVVVLLA